MKREIHLCEQREINEQAKRRLDTETFGEKKFIVTAYDARQLQQILGVAERRVARFVNRGFIRGGFSRKSRRPFEEGALLDRIHLLQAQINEQSMRPREVAASAK